MANSSRPAIEGPKINGEIRPIEHSRPVSSLADDISTIVSNLYSLHIPLTHAYGASSSQVVKLGQTKKDLGEHWEAWIVFFRRCLGHFRTCKLLSPVLEPGEITQLAAIASSTLVEAESIKVNAAQIAKSYNEWLVKSDLQGSHMGSPMHSNAKTISTIRHAYGTSLGALHDCSKCLDEIAIYWADHDYRLREIANASRVAISVLKHEVAVWTSEHEAIRQAISDITACCDALSVTPVDRSKLWEKVIGQVTGKTKMALLTPATVSQESTSLVSPQQKTIREEGFELLTSKHHFDVPSITHSTSQVSQCIHVLYPKTSTKDPKIAFEYSETLNDAENIASGGRSFYQSALRLLEVRGDVGKEMLDQISQIQVSINLVLPKYKKIQEQLSEDPAGREASGNKVNPHGALTPHNGFNTSSHRCQEVVTVVRASEALGHLIQALVGCNEFWSKISSGVEYICASDFDTAAFSGSVRRTWRVEASHYRAYVKEITNTRPQVQNTAVRHDFKSSKRFSVNAKKIFCVDTSNFDDEPA